MGDREGRTRDKLYKTLRMCVEQKRLPDGSWHGERHRWGEYARNYNLGGCETADYASAAMDLEKTKATRWLHTDLFHLFNSERTLYRRQRE